ncbi:beta-lactamase family protein [Hymenobacter busanensis]|uniref:Beta-lactamase family protein n=1 Tax=Hymenobacter busanensis TaxID=2607656 RepID=A0A7L4ZS28_9BACT|nr:serine hydrolase domain-containing protein [Hymenobacter busanensis]KAA9327153.1 beta-lactamase family protein [Hymenobacter busanensis]QHJ05818.1 serine hydrolase [Hymenobacter busanensis]
MRNLIRVAAALPLAALGLSSTASQAQTPRFASFAQFNDTLVARFNRGDFKSMEAYSSPALQKIEAAGAMSGYLKGLQAKTGRIVATELLADKPNSHVFAWRGEKQNLRVRWVSAVPGSLDNYFISDFIAQPNARTAPVRTDNRRQTPLDRAVDHAAALYMQHPDAAGLSIGVYWQGKQYFYNYGEVEKGSGRLPTARTYYDMGSVAKTFVTTLLAQAVLDKKVQLTDDIRRYLPGDYPNLQVDGRPVRLVDLATHTSGLPGRARNYTAANQAQLKALNLQDYTAYYNRFTADSLLHHMHSFQLTSQPGTTYRYNNLGILVLQLVLERAYQQPYEQLVTKYVQTRFGMKDTKRVLSAAEQKRYAIGYDDKQQRQEHRNYTGYWGGTTLSSTPADLLTYAQANLAEREPALKLAHQPAWGNGIGLGWMLDTDPDDQKRVFHNGRNVGFHTRCALYPAQQLGIVVFVNDNISQDRVTEMEQMLTQELTTTTAAKAMPGKRVRG